MLTKYPSIHFPFKKLTRSDDVAFLNTSRRIKMHHVSFRPTFATSYAQSTQMPCHLIPNLVLIFFLNDIVYCYLRNYYSCRPNSIFMNFLVLHIFFPFFVFDNEKILLYLVFYILSSNGLDQLRRTLT